MVLVGRSDSDRRRRRCCVAGNIHCDVILTQMKVLIQSADFVLNTFAESLHDRHGAYQNNFLESKILITLNFQVELARTMGIHSCTPYFRVILKGI